MYELIHKPTFVNQLLGLPRQEVPRVLEKVEALRQDPRAASNNSTQLQGTKTPVYRYRIGNYRVIYAYGNGWITLLGVDNRKDVYRKGKLVAEGPGFDLSELPPDDILSVHATDGGERWASPAVEPESNPVSTWDDVLPVPITEDLLDRLRVPKEHWTVLTACCSVNDLLAVSVPDHVRNRVFDVTTDIDFDRVLEQPNYVSNSIDDLLRYTEGELLGFLLKLDPEQERYVERGLHTPAPTLVKGSPGTGKSTVALHRARRLVDLLRQEGVERPRILFTTYTEPLAALSRQLLDQLLGDDASLAEVRISDEIARKIVEARGGPRHVASREAQLDILARARSEVRFVGNALQQRVQRLAIEKMSDSYLLDEIGLIIHGRGVRNWDEYAGLIRAGRKFPLQSQQRLGVWSLAETFDRLLDETGMTTWHRLHRDAWQTVQADPVEQYDGVIVDEAQDLDPVLLATLVGMVRSPGRLFVTADANQSIYGGGFSWTDLNASLRFHGSTGVLRTNYRSTRAIDLAAATYLRDAGLEDRDATSITSVEDFKYLNEGVKPLMRKTTGEDDEVSLLSGFIVDAARSLRFGLGACAVLVPNPPAGERLAADLRDSGIPAEFASGADLDLSANTVKVLELRTTKGLEFPIVALARLASLADAPFDTASQEERQELLGLSRRTVYVGMTRAMRALLVLVPQDSPSPLFRGFESSRWDV